MTDDSFVFFSEAFSFDTAVVIVLMLLLSALVAEKINKDRNRQMMDNGNRNLFTLLGFSIIGTPAV